MNIGNGQFWRGDCLELMRQIPDASVDMILCDLPYGTTQNKWDSLIPFEPLWAHYWRVAKPNAAIVLTAQPPFDKVLGCSQIQYLKYEWIWSKPKGTGHLNAKKQPMKSHENVLVFYKFQPEYYPQMTEGKPYKDKAGKERSSNYGNDNGKGNDNEGLRYPVSVQNFTSNMRDAFHPTQKPVDLFAYLIRTYTQPGQLVLDNCAGSGTTAIAAEREGRKWLCIEQDETYYNAACGRVWKEVLGL